MSTLLDEPSLERARTRRLMPPASPRSQRAVADTMTLPDGDRAGDTWDVEVEPVQVVCIRALDTRRYRKFSLLTPNQRGKSLMWIALPLVHTLIELSANAAYVMPNLEKLGQQWEGKLRPLITGCGYGAWIPNKGPGSRGGKPAAITFYNPITHERAGTMFFLAASGGGKETSLSAVSAKLVAKDEADDFESEAHLALADKRNEAYGTAGLSIDVSTLNDVKGRQGHPILERIAQGTKTCIWFQCQHCKDKGEFAGFQVLTFDNLVYSGTRKAEAAASARYRCAYCSAMWTEEERKQALQHYRVVHDGQTINAAGDVVGDEKPGDHFSIIANDLQWSRADLGKMAEDHFLASEALRERGNHDLMKLFFFKRRCEDYTADIEEMEMGKEMTWQDLLTRSQKCNWGPSFHTTDKGQQDGYLYSRHVAPIPPKGQWTIGFTDVQDNRIYTCLVAGARDGSTWDMAWSYQYARLDHKPWDAGELYRMLESADIWFHEVCGTLPLVSIGIDTRYGTKDILNWLAAKRSGTWKACMGTGEMMKPQPGDVEGIIWRREHLYHVQTDSTRNLVQAAYRRPNESPGAAHIPNGLSNTASDRAYLAHLVAKMDVIDHKTKKLKLRQGPGRWDWLDTRRGCFALNRMYLQQLTTPKRTITIGNAGSVMK